MADNFLQDGNVVEVTAGAALLTGEGHLVGDLFGVALGNAASGAKVQLKRTGVFKLPKLSADVIAEGVKVYWDSTPGEVLLLATANKLIGLAAKAAGAGVLFVEVILTGEATNP